MLKTKAQFLLKVIYPEIQITKPNLIRDIYIPDPQKRGSIFEPSHTLLHFESQLLWPIWSVSIFLNLCSSQAQEQGSVKYFGLP